eukprot:TRINITY_DN741_c0_g1_i2.p1 TRINITY_DN741_c0_g1~~TRINITY_DN741_c0_g1_i2.p1  ORF type:complete len:121 (+),score=28.46 TRINITY_DN741_c0_g1_i2:115-477(+)
MSEATISVFGGGGVGKSCVIIRYLQGVFFDDYDPTVEDSFRKQVNIDDEPIFINVLDTAGQEEFRTFLERWIKEADAYLLIYSIIDKNSFEHEIPSFYDEIVRIREGKFTSISFNYWHMP